MNLNRLGTQRKEPQATARRGQIGSKIDGPQPERSGDNRRQMARIQQMGTEGIGEGLNRRSPGTGRNNGGDWQKDRTSFTCIRVIHKIRAIRGNWQSIGAAACFLSFCSNRLLENKKDGRLPCGGAAIFGGSSARGLDRAVRRRRGPWLCSRGRPWTGRRFRQTPRGHRWPCRT